MLPLLKLLLREKYRRHEGTSLGYCRSSRHLNRRGDTTWRRGTQRWQSRSLGRLLHRGDWSFGARPQRIRSRSGRWWNAVDPIERAAGGVALADRRDDRPVSSGDL